MIVGKSSARRTRSGTFEGPGICRKWRPCPRSGCQHASVLSSSLRQCQQSVALILSGFVRKEGIAKSPVYTGPDPPLAVARGLLDMAVADSEHDHLAAQLRGARARLARETRGELLLDRASRGRYATDASIYQIMPVGVLVPKTEADIARGDRYRPRPEGARAAARRRHQPVRADDGRRARHRRDEAFPQAARPRHRRAYGIGRARIVSTISTRSSSRTASGFRSTSRRAPSARSAAWPATTPAVRARSPTATWCTTCSASGPPRRRRRARFRPRRCRQRPCRRDRRLRPRPGAPASRRDRGELAESDAPRRRLQPRHLRQPERAALHRRRQRQSRAPARRLGGNAGLHEAA